MFEEPQNVVLTWLDSPIADHGFSFQARGQLSEILHTKTEDSYQLFSNIILDPPSLSDKQRSTKRSWRAMKLLIDDMKAGSSSLINGTTANLLAKEIFVSLERPEINILHVRTLLEALLEAHPSPVISACCAGGKEGMERHLGPLLSPKTSSQTLPTVTNIVLYGCLGKQGKASAEQTFQQQATKKNIELSPGSRRKFVRVLSDWSVLARLIHCITSHEKENPSIGEDVCETILTIVECLGYPEKKPVQEQSNNASSSSSSSSSSNIGEENLLAPLGQQSWWDPLVGMLDGDNTSNAAKVAATRIMMGIFTLATGRSTRIRKVNTIMTDATEKNYDGELNNNEVIEAANKNQPNENKLLEWGLTCKIHESLVGHLPELIHALLRGLNSSGREGEEGATQYFVRGNSPENDVVGVPHPGRCRIVPFTSWRLHVVTLLAEILTYNGGVEENNNMDNNNVKKKKNDKTHDDANKTLRLLAMNVVMELKLPPNDNKELISENEDNSTNPWPFLCDWIFEYPENALYHCQFIRLFKAICIEHHEVSLRVVLQKNKFVSRAIKTCFKREANRGVLVVCLNILRLRCQSLSPSAFLRQFLESHDAWKGFQDELKRITLEQECQSHPVPTKEARFNEPMDIDLGSPYAALLGFDQFEAYQIDPSQETNNVGTTKKKKKKKKKRKGKNPKNIDDETCQDNEED